jgi:hypothetical protein
VSTTRTLAGVAPRVTRLLLGSAVVALLAGCGALNPGVAARLGEDSVSVRDIDETAVLLCEAVEPQLKGDTQQLAMGLPRRVSLQSWIDRTIGEQAAQEYDVTAGSEFEASLAELERSVAALDAGPRAAYIDALSAQAYRTAVLTEVARVQLSDEGVADPTTEQVAERANSIYATWPDTHELEIDPRFGVRFDDGVAPNTGALVDVDTGISVAVSPRAKAGAAAQLDAAYIAALADSQRCG